MESFAWCKMSIFLVMLAGLTSSVPMCLASMDHWTLANAILERCHEFRGLTRLVAVGEYKKEGNLSEDILEQVSVTQLSWSSNAMVSHAKIKE